MAYGFAGKVPHSLFLGFRCSSGCSRVFVGLPIELLYAMLHVLSISSLWLTRFHGKPLASFASIFMVFLSAGGFSSSASLVVSNILPYVFLACLILALPF